MRVSDPLVRLDDLLSKRHAYPRAEENPFIATHTGRTGGKLPNDIELEAVIVKGACCYAAWGYVPVFEGEFE